MLNTGAVEKLAYVKPGIWSLAYKDNLIVFGSAEGGIYVYDDTTQCEALTQSGGTASLTRNNPGSCYHR